MKQLQIIILAQIFSISVYAQSHMAIFNKCRIDKEDDACLYVQLSKEKQEYEKKCGLVFKDKEACARVKEKQIKMGEILSNRPELRTAEADSSDDKIQMARPDKKHRQPTSEDDPNEAVDCDNCG